MRRQQGQWNPYQTNDSPEGSWNQRETNQGRGYQSDSSYDQGRIQTSPRSEYRDTYNYNVDESPNWARSNDRGYQNQDDNHSYGSTRGSYEQSGQRGTMSASGQTGYTQQYGGSDFNRMSSGQDYSQRGSYGGMSGSTGPYGHQYGTSGSFGQRSMGSDYGSDSFASNSYWPRSSSQGSYEGSFGSSYGTSDSSTSRGAYGQGASGSSYGQGQRSDRHQGQFSGRGPKGYRRSDDRIKEEVSDLLQQDPSVDASEIEVNVENGVVTLSGTVTERRMKRLAEECIESSPGVQDVHNELRVSKSNETSSDKSDRADGMSNKPGRSTSSTDKSLSSSKIM